MKRSSWLTQKYNLFSVEITKSLRKWSSLAERKRRFRNGYQISHYIGSPLLYSLIIILFAKGNYLLRLTIGRLFIRELVAQSKSIIMAVQSIVLNKLPYRTQFYCKGNISWPIICSMSFCGGCKKFRAIHASV